MKKLKLIYHCRGISFLIIACSTSINKEAQNNKGESEGVTKPHFKLLKKEL